MLIIQCVYVTDPASLVFRLVSLCRTKTNSFVTWPGRINLCNKLSLEQAFTVRVLAAIAVLIYDAKIRCLGRTPGISVKALSEKAGFSVFACETPPRPDVRQEWITKQIVSSRKRTRFFYSAGWK